MSNQKYTIRGCIGFILITIIFILAISERAYAYCEEPDDWKPYWPYVVKKPELPKLSDDYCYRKPNGQLSNPACKLHPPINKTRGM